MFAIGERHGPHQCDECAPEGLPHKSGSAISANEPSGNLNGFERNAALAAAPAGRLAQGHEPTGQRLDLSSSVVLAAA